MAAAAGGRFDVFEEHEGDFSGAMGTTASGPMPDMRDLTDLRQLEALFFVETLAIRGIV